MQDKTSLLDAFKIGDEVKVSINIRGNAYNGKWYCNLNGWKIEKLSDAVEVLAEDNGQVPDNDSGLPF